MCEKMVSYSNQIDYSTSDSEWHGRTEGQVFPSLQQFKQMKFKDMKTFQLRKIEFKTDDDKTLRSLRFTFSDDDENTVIQTPLYGVD